MAENKSTLHNTVSALTEGLDGFVSSKTVVGDPVMLGDTTIIPLMDVSFGLGAGAMAGDKRKNTGGGAGGKISPCAVIVMQGDSTRIVNVKNQDGITKILDMVPDYVNQFIQKNEARKNPKKAEAVRVAKEEASDDLKDKLNIEDF